MYNCISPKSCQENTKLQTGSYCGRSDLCGLNYVRPMPLCSKEKLRKYVLGVLRIVKHKEY